MILDKHAALERIEQDQQLYDDICEIFRDDVPHILVELTVALNEGDIAVATRHAHSLKSAAANIGASELSEAARLAEHAFRSGDLKNSQTLLADIDQQLMRVLEVIQ